MKPAANVNFSAILAFSVHEMKNSLSIINELIQQFSKKNLATDHKELSQLEFEANRMNNSLMQLLILYKIEGAQFAPTIDECVALDILNEVVAQQSSLFSINGLTLTVDCPDDLLCYCDNSLISNAITTVVNNSQHYAHSQVLLTVDETQDGYICFTVEDDGKGYPDQFLQPDTIENTPVNLNTGSTGLGLFFVATIAKMHTNGDKAGYIKLSNDSVLGGAKFSLYLP